MAAQHSPCTTPDEWIVLANRELDNIAASYRGRATNDAKCDFALRSVEFALKAILWKTHKATEWPKRNRKTKWLYGHDLPRMLAECDPGLQQKLQQSAAHFASWKSLMNAIVMQYRYAVTPPADKEANEIARSARHPDEGVVPWLLKHDHQMP